MAQPRKAKLGLDAALCAEKFVPFIDHHAGELFELATGILVGEHQGKALRGGDEREGQALAELGFPMR